MKGDENIMFRITEKEYDEMVTVISKCCCLQPDPCPYCSKIDCCDVQIIYGILRNHLEKGYIKSDEEEHSREWIDREHVIDWDDSIPFKK